MKLLISLLVRLYSFVVQASFNLTGFFLAGAALKCLVRTFPETFRVTGVLYFPMNQHDAGSEEQTPAEKVLNKEHRCKHHKVTPVINPAVDAALVVHKN